MLQPREHHVAQSLCALLTGLVDYAGLFPPAALDMDEAVRNYARYLTGDHAWMLGRFVLPAQKLAEFERARLSVPMPQEWKLTALLGTDVAAEIEVIAEFNLRNAGRARVDAIETKAADSRDIRQVDALLPARTAAYFEIAPERAAELIGVVRAIGGGAKIRTGGVVPEAIPSAEAIARFIAECASAEVPFKATAGLHHPLRCVKPLTYDNNPPIAKMHGFLNVFLAAMLCYRVLTQKREESRLDVLTTLLEATSPDIEFTDEAAMVRISQRRGAGPVGIETVEATISTPHIRQGREHFATSFGSCSFEEPISDLRNLNFL